MMKELLALVLLLLCAPVAAAGEEPNRVQRVEPPFWWTGMKQPDLQLMVYGDELSGLKPELTYPGVELLDSVPVENDNYLFINLRLSPEASPGTVAIALKDGEETRTIIHYQLKQRVSGSAARRGFDASDAIYLITPDRFANGDSGNDSIASLREEADRNRAGGRHGGDIAGMRRHLDYIADMGFTAIWPNPLLENDQPAYSYHGYAATDFYKIDPRFGSNGDYRAFVAAAREKNLGVIQDMVLNHIGSEHWWLRDLPTDDWLNGEDINEGDYQLTNHSRTTQVDPYAAAVDHRAFVQGWFVDTMPDLNQRSPLLANYLIQNSIWWIEFAGLSGIRTDTYSYSDPQFLQQWSKRIGEEYPNFSIVGEEWTRNPALVSYWQKDKQNPDGYRSYAQSMMDFPLHYALRESLVERDSWNSGLTQLYESLANDFLYPHPNRLVIFGGNHDTSRLYSWLEEDFSLYKMAVAYLATMRGTPQFFYGDELLMTSPKERNDGIVRSDFPGGWPGDKRNGFTGKGLTEREKEAQQYVKALFNWRRDTSAIHSGRLKHYTPEGNTYVYFRYDDQSKIMVAINKADEPRELDMQRFSEVITDESRGVDVVSGQVYSLKGLAIPARDVLVLELK